MLRKGLSGEPFTARLPFTQLIGFGVPPGLAPEQMNLALERFARKVMPRLRARPG